MVSCRAVAFVLSGVLLAGLGYILYTPNPPHLANWWTLQYFNARVKAAVISGEILYRAGLKDRMTSLRDAITSTSSIPLKAEDKAGLEIYDTKLNGVSVRVYKPKSAKGPLPGLVYYHGGGFIVLDVPSYDGFCARIARRANIIVVSVEYRLAPEFPFPAGFEDCLQVALYALKNGDKVGLDPSRISVGGDSAGANLAAAVAIKLRNEKVKPSLKAQAIIYGLYQLCDLTLPSYQIREKSTPGGGASFVAYLSLYVKMTDAQKKLMAENKHLTPDMQKKCDKLVDIHLLPKDLLPDDHVRPDRLATSITDDVEYINSWMDDLRVAPLMEEDLSNMPPSFVLAADCDNLRDENLIFAERLKLAGNKVRLLYLQDSFHGVLNALDYGFDAGPKALEEIVSFLNEELK